MRDLRSPAQPPSACPNQCHCALQEPSRKPACLRHISFKNASRETGGVGKWQPESFQRRIGYMPLIALK
jgi:hypothetical protein